MITSDSVDIQLLEERVSRFIRFGEGSFEELILLRMRSSGLLRALWRLLLEFRDADEMA